MLTELLLHLCHTAGHRVMVVTDSDDLDDSIQQPSNVGTTSGET